MLIDLYCHGCPSMNVWKKFIKDVKIKTRQSKIDYVNFRSKIKGWGSFYVVVVVVDGNLYTTVATIKIMIFMTCFF